MASKVKVTYYSSSSDDELQSDSSYELGGESNSDDEAMTANSKKPADRKVGPEALVDVMTKILNKQKPEKGSVILAKGTTDKVLQKKRKLKERQERKQRSDGDADGSDESDDSDVDFSKLSAQRQKKRLWENMGRVKPEVLEREKERQLQRTATKGVVQLFNAVRKQQKQLEDKLSEAGTERKKDKVMQTMTKGKFMDVLKGSVANISTEPVTKKIKAEMLDSETVQIKEEKEDDNPSWNILRDDFMMGAKMKDWDKESDGESGASPSDLSDSDSET